MTAVAEFKFKAGVLHITHVTKRFRFTYITWDRHFDNHAVGFLDIVVGSECEGAVEECEVKTYVGSCDALPRKLRRNERRSVEHRHLCAT